MTVRQGMTVAEYLALPERKPYLEYDEGEVYAKSMPEFFHGSTATNLIEALLEYRKRAGGRLGPEWRIELRRGSIPVRYYIPDVAYYAEGRPIRGPRALHPPTLVVEITSPDDSLREARQKCRRYVDGGVDVAWLIDPRRRTVEVFDAEVDGFEWQDAILTHRALPGFQLPVEKIFEGLDDEPIYD